MVKIRIKQLLLSLVIFLFLMSATYAATNKLVFDDVDVRVGGRSSNNLNNRDTIREEAKPGDSVEFRINMKNNYTSAEDLRIEDIRVNVKIEAIDDQDDLEEESNEFDLSAGSSKRATLKFQVPLEVDEDTFDVLIEADGDDRNGTAHEIQMRLKLEVDKENHLIKLTRNSLSPAEVACNRKNVQLAVTLLNIGAEDEEDVSLQIYNPDLGIDIKDPVGTLEAEPNEPESRFSKVYRFNVPTDLEEGSYPIAVRVLYDNERRKSEETVTLTVNACGTPRQENKTQGVDLSTPTPIQPERTTVVVQQVPPDTTVSTEGFFKGNGFVIAIIIAEIIAVVVGIVLLITLFGRR